MSDLDQLRGLTDRVRPPSLDSLRETARRRDRRMTMTAVAGVVAVVLAVTGLVTARNESRTIDPLPAPDTKIVIEGDYAPDQVHDFEAIQVDNSGDRAADTDLTVSAGLFLDSTWAYWCAGRPDLSYVVYVTRRAELDWTKQIGMWRAGGSCDGDGSNDQYDDESFSGDRPPEKPVESMMTQNMRFNPLPQDQEEPITLRVVLTASIPGSVQGCFDLPGGYSPAECRDEAAVQPVADADGASFGAVVFTRPVEYVATVAGVPVQAQAADENGEWRFAGGVQALPDADSVTLETNAAGFVYVVQSDPVGRADCAEAYEQAVSEGDQWHFEGDSENWGCTMKEAKLRLLIDGSPITKAQFFRRDWFDFGALAVDADHHEITVERVGGAKQVEFGLVQFEEES